MRFTLTAKITLGVTLLVALAVVLGTLNLYLSLRRELHVLHGERLAGAARLAAAQIPARDLVAIPAGAAAEGKRARAAREVLAAARRAYALELPLAVLRTTPVENQLEYVVTTRPDGPASGALYLASDYLLYAILTREVMYTNPYAAAAGGRISAFAPIMGADGITVGVVKVDYDMDAYFTELQTRMAWVILFSSSLALLGGALGAGFARRLTRPIQRLVDATHHVEAGDYTTHVPVRGSDEIARLSAAFNGMVDGLRERDRVKSAFAMYLAPQVAERLIALSDVLHLEGERRQVTVLISDVRDYTALAEGMDPEALVHALNEYFDVLMGVVIEREGTIDKFMGDGLLAYFGAPLPQDDHRERALDAACQMQIALAAFNARRRDAGQPPLLTGIGLAVGEVLIGNIGSEKHLEYTIIGDAVNLASRLCAEAAGGHVIAATSVLDGIGHKYVANRLAPVTVKGFTAPVEITDVAVESA